MRVEWYRVTERRKVRPSGYDSHTFEPVVFRHGMVYGAGWRFLEANYPSLGLSQDWFRRMYHFGWARGDP